MGRKGARVKLSEKEELAASQMVELQDFPFRITEPRGLITDPLMSSLYLVLVVQVQQIL